MEKTIKMPLSEYTKLIEEHKILEKYIGDKESVLITRTVFYGGPAGMHYNYAIISPNELMKFMVEKMNELSKEKWDLEKELNELKYKKEFGPKKWYQF